MCTLTNIVFKVLDTYTAEHSIRVATGLLDAHAPALSNYAINSV